MGLGLCLEGFGPFWEDLGFISEALGSIGKLRASFGRRWGLGLTLSGFGVPLRALWRKFARWVDAGGCAAAWNFHGRAAVFEKLPNETT